MNERIKQIADQCGLYIAYDNREVTDKELSFFAETIIKECSDIATMNQFQWDSAGGYVLKHFGIKE